MRRDFQSNLGFDVVHGISCGLWYGPYTFFKGIRTMGPFLKVVCKFIILLAYFESLVAVMEPNLGCHIMDIYRKIWFLEFRNLNLSSL